MTGLDIVGCSWVGLNDDGTSDVVLLVCLDQQADILCVFLRCNSEGLWSSPAIQRYESNTGNTTEIELGELFPLDSHSDYVSQLIGAAKLARADYIRTDGYGIPF